jgi:urocanate hydratase
VEVMLAFQKQGAMAFEYGNNIRAQAVTGGVKDAFDIPGFMHRFIRPLFYEAVVPFAGLPSLAIPLTSMRLMRSP